jgi:hypothetical protein
MKDKLKVKTKKKQQTRHKKRQKISQEQADYNPDLLTSIENAYEYIANTDYCFKRNLLKQSDFIWFIKKELSIISAEYGITTSQAIILCYFLTNYDNDITERGIAKFLGISIIELLRYQDDINILIKRELIRNWVNVDGADIIYGIVPDVINALRNGEKYIPNTSKKDTPCEETTVKELFYNEAEEESISKLEHALDENNFQAVQKRLREKGMPGGIICFFYGEPGTGKTETAIQLAHKTGRDIFNVELSSIMDKYVGESEKNIKAVFDDYYEFSKKCKLTPILLFNEADGIFSRRLTIDNDSKSVAQMHNTVQNIILEELENFEGILIATTNLSDNMDQAFERRFLYKIEFKKPGVRVRQSIWKSLLPELSQDDINVLAEKFDFTGGNIQNIAKKSNINYVISGKTSDYTSIEALCKEEHNYIYTKEPVIGFKNNKG